ncbi:MAG: tryptophan synthase subunit alpha [Spirochaetota bacterium]
MSTDKIRLMAHLVAGYPDDSGCRAVAQGLVEGGASYLEVQIPFSDPSADGPAIREAGSAVLASGYRVRDALAFVAELCSAYPGVPVFVMTYGSLAASPDVHAFVEIVRKAGAAGLIVPDFPFDADEGLAQTCLGGGRLVCPVPVAAPSMRPQRLAKMADLGREYLYAALRAGVTGAQTEISEDTKAFLAAAGAGGARILGGFGIRTAEQTRKVAPYVHAVVAGSVFVELITRIAGETAGSTGHQVGSAGESAGSRGSGGSMSISERNEALRQAVREKTAELCGITDREAGQ